jgi:hypothetical protein
VQTVRSYALLVATALTGLLALPTVLDQIGRCLAAGCRMNPRQHHLNAYQLLFACALAAPLGPVRLPSGSRLDLACRCRHAVLPELRSQRCAGMGGIANHSCR